MDAQPGQRTVSRVDARTNALVATIETGIKAGRGSARR
jgi:hypothetical protein